MKCEIIFTRKSPCLIKAMKFNVALVVRVGVKLKNLSNLSILIEGLSSLATSDPCVLCTLKEEGENLVVVEVDLYFENS
jgi:translation elongation factor EF-G